MSIEDEIDKIRQKLDEETTTIVSIALFGQPGAGKSSLINKIVGKKVAETGVETDKTVDAKKYEVNRIQLVDLPGYGTKNFPKETYFQKFNILEFDLFLCVTSGKFHQADTDFFKELLRKGKICIFVANNNTPDTFGNVAVRLTAYTLTELDYFIQVSLLPDLDKMMPEDTDPSHTAISSAKNCPEY